MKSKDEQNDSNPGSTNGLWWPPAQYVSVSPLQTSAILDLVQLFSFRVSCNQGCLNSLAKDELEPLFFLPLPSKFWDYRHRYTTLCGAGHGAQGFVGPLANTLAAEPQLAPWVPPFLWLDFYSQSPALNEFSDKGSDCPQTRCLRLVVKLSGRACVSYTWSSVVELRGRACV